MKLNGNKLIGIGRNYDTIHLDVLEIILIIDGGT
jgi:hypothetical protein